MSLLLKNENYLTVAEASKYIGRANQTVYQFWKKWGWQGHRYGSTLLFKQSQIDDWLEVQIIQDVAS